MTAPAEIIRQTSRELVARLPGGCKPCGGDLMAYLWHLRGNLIRIRLTCLDHRSPECLDGDELQGRRDNLLKVMRMFMDEAHVKEVWH
jgi:hypothetical protein